jgi:type IV fimbrial biogenesis protein FimT
MSPRPAAGVGAARGFTAVELLVVIAIVTLLATIAMPSFAEFTVKQRMRVAVYDLITDITFARGEAVKRNARVTISRVGSSWAGGWTIDDVNGNRLRTHTALNASVTESSGPATVTFGLDGRQVGSTTATFTFDDSGAKASIPIRRVVLDASGKPKSI